MTDQTIAHNSTATHPHVVYWPRFPMSEPRGLINTYDAILDRVDDTGFGQFHQADIALDTGQSQSTVGRHYKRLRELGHLHPSRGHPEDITSVWVLGNPGHTAPTNCPVSDSDTPRGI